MIAALLSLLLTLLPILGVGTAAAADFPLDTNDDVIEDAVGFLLNEQSSDGSIGGFAISAWAAMALAAADVAPRNCEGSSGDSIIDYIENDADTSDFEATDWARMILAIVAAGEDPGDFGGENYIDALEDLYEDDSATGYCQIGDPHVLNDDFWGVLALVAADQSVNSETIDFIYANQNDDGGWSWAVGEDSDVDDTAAAIMALIAVGEDEDSAEIEDAIDFLASVQNEDGGFPQYGGEESNCASDAWAIMAIVAVGDDPNGSDWMLDGNTPVDHLLSLQDSDDGHFQFEDGDDRGEIWNTAYAIPALLGTPYPVSATSSVGGGEASIGYGPSRLEFVATAGGEPPLDRTVVVWNDGDGVLVWEADADESWLLVSPSSGSSSGEEDEIEVSVDLTGLSAGEYDAIITISSTDADNSPVEVYVSLEVCPAEDDVYIAFSPEELRFTAEEGGADPDDKVVEVWNGGPGLMDVEIESDKDWLDVSPDEASSSGEHIAIAVSVDVDDLDADDYQATIIITSDEADNNPVEIDVSLEIEESASQGDDPEIGFSPDELEFEAVEGGDDPDEGALEIWNDGDGELEWAVTANVDWLKLSPDEGTSTGEEDEVEVTVDIDDLSAGEYTARITITALGATTQRVDVTLTVEEVEDDGGSEGDNLLILRTLALPAGAGTITRSIPPGLQGYDNGTVVELTAVPAQGYAFTGWAGDVSGTDNPLSVTVNSDLNITAYFVRFNAVAVPEVSLTYASPQIAVVTVIPYPVQSIPSSPRGFSLVKAYVVDPQGTGSFTLRFDGLTDAQNVGVFKVVSGAWMQVPRAVIGTTALEVTLPAQDPVIALARAGSGFNIMGQLQGLFGEIDILTLAIIGAAAFVVIMIIIALVVVRRRGRGCYY